MLTWSKLEEMLREMNKRGEIGRLWEIKEEALVFIVKHTTGYYPIARTSMINTFTKDGKILEVRVTDNYKTSDAFNTKETQKYTERFEKALERIHN